MTTVVSRTQPFGQLNRKIRVALCYEQSRLNTQATPHVCLALGFKHIEFVGSVFSLQGPVVQKRS